jgi:hypothetical protein
MLTKLLPVPNELSDMFLDFFRGAAPRLGFWAARGITLNVVELPLHHPDVFAQSLQFGAEDVAFLAYLVPTFAKCCLGFVRLFDQLLKHALQHIAAPCQSQLFPLASLTHLFSFHRFPGLSANGSTLSDRDADGGK